MDKDESEITGYACCAAFIIFTIIVVVAPADNDVYMWVGFAILIGLPCAVHYRDHLKGVTNTVKEKVSGGIQEIKDKKAEKEAEMERERLEEERRERQMQEEIAAREREAKQLRLDVVDGQVKLGRDHEGWGRFTEAREAYERALEQARADGLTVRENQLQGLIERLPEREATYHENKQRIQTLLSTASEKKAANDLAEAETALTEAQELLQGMHDEVRLSEVTTRLQAVREERDKIQRQADFEQRVQLFRRALKMYEEIPFEKLASLLELPDANEAERWVISLPQNFPIKIAGESLRVSGSVENVTSAIDQLMGSFDDWERRKVGKIE